MAKDQTLVAMAENKKPKRISEHLLLVHDSQVSSGQKTPLIKLGPIKVIKSSKIHFLGKAVEISEQCSYIR